MPRFENEEAFWEISLAGSSFTTRWGRKGSAGMQATKRFDSDAEARAAHDNLIAQRIRLGYHPLAVELPSVEAVTARDPGLEALIREAPDDSAAKLVYADWLTSRGDPRGELIALYDAFHSETDHAKLVVRKRAIEELHARHPAALLGTPDSRVKLKWRTGFLTSVQVRAPTAELADILAAVLGSPTAIAVTQLTVVADDDRQCYDAAFEILGRLRPPLRQLTIGGSGLRASPGDTLGDLAPLYPVLGTLRELELVGALALGAVDLPQLVRLELGVGTTPEMLAAVAAATLPSLATLALKSTWHARDVVPLASARGLVALRLLSIPNTTQTVEILGTLAGSRVLAGLERLGLARGDFDDGAVTWLIKRIAAFEHLAALEIGEQLTEAGCRRLAPWEFVEPISREREARYERTME